VCQHFRSPNLKRNTVIAGTISYHIVPQEAVCDPKVPDLNVSGFDDALKPGDLSTERSHLLLMLFCDLCEL
jgi:hypothetical protein